MIIYLDYPDYKKSALFKTIQKLTVLVNHRGLPLLHHASPGGYKACQLVTGKAFRRRDSASAVSYPASFPMWRSITPSCAVTHGIWYEAQNTKATAQRL